MVKELTVEGGDDFPDVTAGMAATGVEHVRRAIIRNTGDENVEKITANITTTTPSTDSHMEIGLNGVNFYKVGDMKTSYANVSFGSITNNDVMSISSKTSVRNGVIGGWFSGTRLSDMEEVTSNRGVAYTQQLGTFSDLYGDQFLSTDGYLTGTTERINVPRQRITNPGWITTFGDYIYTRSGNILSQYAGGSLVNTITLPNLANLGAQVAADNDFYYIWTVDPRVFTYTIYAYRKSDNVQVASVNIGRTQIGDQLFNVDGNELYYGNQGGRNFNANSINLTRSTPTTSPALPLELGTLSPGQETDLYVKRVIAKGAGVFPNDTFTVTVAGV